MTRRWAGWIHDALTPTPGETERVASPVSTETMDWARDATTPHALEVQRLIAGQAAYRQQRDRRRVWIGSAGALAGFALVALMLTPLLLQGPDFGDVQVTTGEEVWVGHEAMSLGPSIEIVGVARMRVDAAGPEGTVVQMLEGKAKFQVEDGPYSDLLVNVGDLSFRGVGTFEITRQGEVTLIEVQEGELVVRELGRQVRLTSGSVHRFGPGGLSEAKVRPAGVEAADLPPEPPPATEDTAVDNGILAAAEAAVRENGETKPQYQPLRRALRAPVADVEIVRTLPDPESTAMVRPKDIVEVVDPSNRIPPDTIAWIKVQDLMDREAHPTLLVAALDRFVGAHPGSAHADEAQYTRLFLRAESMEPRSAAREIEVYLRANPRAKRAPDLRYMLATIQRDRLQDCQTALGNYKAVANGAHGELSTLSLAWWGLCAHAQGLPTARPLLERAQHNALPPELASRVDEALQKP